MGQLPAEGLVSVRAPSPTRVQVQLNHLSSLRKFDAVECQMVFYPYSDTITSKDYTLLPFEEYVKDLTQHNRSAYACVKSSAKEVFGVLLGVLVFLVVLRYTHSDVVTMESLIGIFISYFIGKDLWDDIEEILQDLTRSSRLQYRERDYHYQIDRGSTIHMFNRFASRKRHGQNLLYPSELDVVMRSQSGTVRMRFMPEDFPTKDGESAHLLTVSLDPRKAADLRSRGYLMGLKATFCRRVLFITHNTDFYQSLDEGKKGCMGDAGEWLPGKAFMRTHLALGRLRLILKTGYLENASMFA